MASTSGMGSFTNPTSTTSSQGVSRSEANALVRQVNRLLNRQLSSVCQVNGVKSTGIKAELQNRIANLIQEAVNNNDAVRFQQIRQSVHNTISNTPAGASPSRANHSHAAHNLPSVHMSLSMTNSGNAARGSPSLGNGNRARQSPYGTPQAVSLTFKPSPFYHIEAPIVDARICEAMTQHRNSVTLSLKVNDHPALDRCVSDTSYRALVFCAGDCLGQQDIAFPHQSELRVNGGDVKANLRGLKNKPGSTRPVDITSALRLRPNYNNSFEFTYALTSKKFYLVIYLCKVTSVDELVTRISAGKRIPIESVKQELNEKAQDPDVVATSQVLSLKCPLSYMRLALPCRGLSCTHLQCFDATSYLQLQEQGPQWLCPICNKSATFDQLAVDEYVRDILAKTSKNLETVTIEPNGQWHIKATEEGGHSQTNGNSSYHDDYEKANNNDNYFDDDDDEVLISEVNTVGHRRQETPKNPISTFGTPGTAGRDSSSVGPRGLASVSGKRPAAAVIDLTLSDDEDSEPVERAPKRQNTSSNGVHGSNSLGYLNESPLGYP